MPERVVKLAATISSELSKNANAVVGLTRQTRLLAINAQIEAAHAGEAGAGFNVVAEEVKRVSQAINEIADEMSSSLSAKLKELEKLGADLVHQVRGQRYADLAFNLIDVVDRNLYERSCDVRWWATDSAVVQCLSDPNPEAVRYCTHRLGVILDSYTVYQDLWVLDMQGKVVAHARPGEYPAVQTVDAKAERWFRDSLGISSGHDYRAFDVARQQALKSQLSAVYTTLVREKGEANGKPLGMLAVFFDWEKQAESFLNSIRLNDDERDTTRVMILDSKNRIIASAPACELLTSEYSLSGKPTDKKKGNYRNKEGHIVGYALTPGYETYPGLGWYGVVSRTK